jgi:hypothetical protein
MDSADRGLSEPAPAAFADDGRRELPAGRRPSPRRVRAQASVEERRPGSAAGWRRVRPGWLVVFRGGPGVNEASLGPDVRPAKAPSRAVGWTGSGQEADRDHTAGR